MILPNSTQLTKNARNFKDFAQLQKEIKNQSGEDLSSLTIYYLKDDKKYYVLDTQKTFEEYKEYKKSEKNIKVYFIKNTEYKPTEHLVERIQAKGGNQASLVKDIEEKMNAKTKELQHDIEKLMTKTKNDFTKELNELIKKVNDMTLHNSKLKNYFENALYLKFKEENLELNYPQDPSQLKGEKCSFCNEGIKDKGYKCGLSKKQDYYLCKNCNEKLAGFYPHNFIEIL
jgi:hypothetical protein